MADEDIGPELRWLIGYVLKFAIAIALLAMVFPAHTRLVLFVGALLFSAVTGWKMGLAWDRPHWKTETGQAWKKSASSVLMSGSIGLLIGERGRLASIALSCMAVGLVAFYAGRRVSNEAWVPRADLWDLTQENDY